MAEYDWRSADRYAVTITVMFGDESRGNAETVFLTHEQWRRLHADRITFGEFTNWVYASEAPPDWFPEPPPPVRGTH